MIKYLVSPLLFIMFLINPLLSVEVENHSNISSSISCDKALLLNVPKSKGTVGIVPYVIRNDNLYVLLGRERENGPKEKAGMYCDLGGSLKLDGSRVIDNLIRELREESCKVFDLSEKEVLQKGKLLYKKSDKGREIYYLLYPLRDEEYRTADFLRDTVNGTLEKRPEYLEKDQFMWVNVQDLLNLKNPERIKLRDIDGKENIISLRPFFYNDFCKHEKLRDIIDNVINSPDFVSKKYVMQ